MTLKPFIKWVGGKRQLIQQIAKYIPNDFSTWENATYIEPFVGGGAMLFHMLATYENIHSAIINDANTDLIACYRVIKETPSNLIKCLKEIELEYDKATNDGKKAFYLERRNEYNTRRAQLDQTEVAALFIFLNRVCFNGLYRVNKSGQFNVPFGKNMHPTICDEATIMSVHEVMQKVTILNGDFECTYQKADKCLYYFDPPYRPLNTTSNFNNYTKDTFNDSEQERLKRFCDKINAAGQTFMLSNSDCASCGDPYFDELYKEYAIDRVMAARIVNSNVSARGKITEILVHNR